MLSDKDKYPIKLRISFLFFISSISILYFYFFNFNVNVLDEGIGLLNSYFSVHGLLPYKDFWTIYTPGFYYIFGFIMNIAGWSLIHERIIFLLIFLLTHVVTYILVIRFSSHYFAISINLIIAVYISSFHLYGKNLPLALLFILLIIYLLSSYFDTKKKIFLIFNSLVSGLLLLIRIDFGIYMILVTISSLLIWHLILNIKEIKITNKLLIKEFFIFLVLILLIIFPVLIILLNNVSFNEIAGQALIAPLTIFSQFRSLPFPDNIFSQVQQYLVSGIFSINKLWLSIVFLIPLIIYIISFFKVYFNIRNKKGESKTLIIIMSLIITGLLLYIQALVRSDLEHLFPTILISIILIPYINQISIKKFNIKGLGIIILLIYALQFSYIIKNIFEIRNSGLVEITSPAGKSIKLIKTWGDDYNKVINYILSNTLKGDKIFIGLSRHDVIDYNDVMLYFLTQRLPATKYYELHPGIATDDNIQIKIIDDLKRNKVNLILIWDVPLSDELLKRTKPGSVRLDNYINKNYYIVEQFGKYKILKIQNNIFHYTAQKKSGNNP